MESLKKVADIIKDRNNFLIMGHIDPDGDCVGSMFALKWILDKLNKKSLLLLNTSPEDQYDYFFEKVKKHKKSKTQMYALINKFNLDDLSWDQYNFISLDSSDEDRLGEAQELIDNNYLINIDHHPDNTNYGNINYINSDKAAVGEIIYDLTDILNINIDKKIGEAIATAIITDTGSLQYENTSSRVLRILADLMDQEIDLYKLNRKIYGNYSFNSVKLKGMALSTLDKTEDSKIAWLYVDKEMMEKTNTEVEDTTGFVNYSRDIKGVEVGIAFFEQKPKKISVSFRSNSYVSVNEIASRFDGGGHPKAAGCTIEENLNKTINMVIEEVKKFV